MNLAKLHSLFMLCEILALIYSDLKYGPKAQSALLFVHYTLTLNAKAYG